jgi:hypothetical protein
MKGRDLRVSADDPGHLEPIVTGAPAKTTLR